MYEEDLCRDYLKRVKLPKDDSLPKQPLLEEEVQLLDACFDKRTLKGICNYCIVHLMPDCGLRSQEVRSLCFEHLVPAHNLLHIYVSKECKSRITMIPDFLLDAIGSYRFLVKRRAGVIFHGLKDTNPLSENALKQIFSDLKKESGIPRLHAHLLRHTFATGYLMGGGNLEFLRVLLGHYDYTVTKNYSSLAAQYRMLGIPVYRLDPIFFRTLPWTPFSRIRVSSGHGLFYAQKKAPQPAFIANPRTSNAPPGARTLDTLIKSQVLYQLS